MPPWRVYLCRLVAGTDINAYRHYNPGGKSPSHDLPGGLPDALYCSSVLPAKRVPSWSPVNITQVPSTLLQKHVD